MRRSRLSLAALALTVAVALPVPMPVAVAQDQVQRTYVWRAGDSLSDVLYKLGLGRRKGDEQLYGPQGWLVRNRKANPEIKDWDKVKVGQRIKLVLPARFGKGEDGTVPAPVPAPAPAPVSPPKLKPAPPPTPPAAADSETNTETADEHSDAPTSPTPTRPSKRDLLPPPRTPMSTTELAVLCGAALAAAFAGLGVRARRRREEHAMQENERRWLDVVTRLLSCPSAEFPGRLEGAMRLKQLPPAHGALRALQEAMTAPFGARDRALAIYRLLALQDHDLRALKATRAEDRLAAATRLAELDDPNFAGPIAAAFDSNVRIASSDVERVLGRVRRGQPA